MSDFGLPKWIKVGAFDYRVEAWHTIAARAAERMGECSPQEKVIRVDAAYAPPVVAKCLMHEVLHAAAAEFSVPFNAGEEAAVRSLSLALAAVMRDNPGLLPAIAAALQPATASVMDEYLRAEGWPR